MTTRHHGIRFKRLCRRFRCFVCLAAALSVTVPARNGDRYAADASTSALAYLRLPLNARVAALEEAVASSGDDAACAMINPALIARTDRIKITTMMEWMTLDRRHLFGGVVYPFSRYFCSIGAGFAQYGVHGIERRDENGILLGAFSDLENTIALWFGSAFIDSCYCWGLAAKYHFNYLDDARARGLSFDLGFFSTPANTFSVAITANMLAGSLAWDTGEKEHVIPSFRAGLSCEPYKRWVTLSSDIEWTPRNYPQAHCGAEYRVAPYLCLRSGIQGPNPIRGSGGIGVDYKNIIVDYAFVYHQSTLGHSHLLSVGVAFGHR